MQTTTKMMVKHVKTQVFYTGTLANLLYLFDDPEGVLVLGSQLLTAALQGLTFAVALGSKGRHEANKYVFY